MTMRQATLLFAAVMLFFAMTFCAALALHGHWAMGIFVSLFGVCIAALAIQKGEKK